MRLAPLPFGIIRIIILEVLLIWGSATIGEMVVAAPLTDSITARHWVVWYGDDDRIHRQQVDVDTYLELRNSLRQVRTEDLQRLKNLAADYLRIDLQLVFADLATRREAFLLSLFDFGTSSTLLGTALTAAETAQNAANVENINNPENPEKYLEQVRAATAKEVVNRFRSQLIAPQTTLRALRVAAGRSLTLLKQDLLQNCDRYDRAFRGFVLESNTTIQTLDATTGWQVDIAWRPETATFRSLCTGLRHVDPGIYLAESSLMESFTNAEPSMYSTAWELVLPIAKTALELEKYTEDTSTTLGWFPKHWIRPPVTFISYIAHTRILARRVGERLNVRHTRPPLRVMLQKTLEDLQLDLMERLQATCNQFITAELDRIELGLAARGEGAWSTP